MKVNNISNIHTHSHSLFIFSLYKLLNSAKFKWIINNESARELYAQALQSRLHEPVCFTIQRHVISSSTFSSVSQPARPVVHQSVNHHCQVCLSICRRAAMCANPKHTCVYCSFVYCKYAYLHAHSHVRQQTHRWPLLLPLLFFFINYTSVWCAYASLSRFHCIVLSSLTLILSVAAFFPFSSLLSVKIPD